MRSLHIPYRRAAGTREARGGAVLRRDPASAHYTRSAPHPRSVPGDVLVAESAVDGIRASFTAVGPLSLDPGRHSLSGRLPPLVSYDCMACVSPSCVCLCVLCGIAIALPRCLSTSPALHLPTPTPTPIPLSLPTPHSPPSPPQPSIFPPTGLRFSDVAASRDAPPIKEILESALNQPGIPHVIPPQNPALAWRRAEMRDASTQADLVAGVGAGVATANAAVGNASRVGTTQSSGLGVGVSAPIAVPGSPVGAQSDGGASSEVRGEVVVVVVICVKGCCKVQGERLQCMGWVE